MRRVELLAATLLALGVSPSCRLFRRAPKTPPPVTTPVPPAAPKTEAKPVVLPTPPSVAPTESPVKAPPSAEVTPLPPAPPKQTKRPQPSKATARPPAAVKPDPEPAEPPKTEAPPAAQLGELISDRQRSELNRQIDQSLERARQNLARLASRAVTAAGAEARQRIESFIKQAEAIRKDDPMTAKNLAERAEVLSQDLARN